MKSRYERNKQSVARYQGEREEIRVWVPRNGLKKMAQTHASSRGESLSEFVRRAIEETIQRDLRPGNDMDDGINPSFLAYELLTYDLARSKQ